MNFISAMHFRANKLLTLDAGHYHPTEGIADKISSVMQFLPEIPVARQPGRALGTATTW